MRTMSERRYTEEEVAAIFELAAEKERTTPKPVRAAEGMTLATLQEIGQEVGIAPVLVAEAARSLDRVGHPSVGRYLGFPLRVGRAVELGRKLTDGEWERLVVDLRQTFDATGKVRREGSLRQWSNGNLKVLVEPSGPGDRVRLQTMNGAARGLMAGGLGLLGAAAAILIGGTVAGAVPDPSTVAGMTFLGLMGAGMFGSGALRLPGWARRRRRQMEDVAQRLALAETGETSDSADGGGEPEGMEKEPGR